LELTYWNVGVVAENKGVPDGYDEYSYPSLSSISDKEAGPTSDIPRIPPEI
jgi:hypothetical protein